MIVDGTINDMRLVPSDDVLPNSEGSADFDGLDEELEQLAEEGRQELAIRMPANDLSLSSGSTKRQFAISRDWKRCVQTLWCAVCRMNFS
jgi:hypothetical protein